MGKFSGPPPGRKYRVIELRLMRPDDMFEVPQTDVFSEYRNFLTGVEFCLSALRGSLSRRPVRLEIQLPPGEISAGLDDRLARTLRRYCEHRLRYNRWESRALRFGGISALRIGVPVTALGLILTVLATRMRPAGDAANVITDHVGWVLAWIGLWFPLDEFLFYPLSYGRESRGLRLLSDATVTLSPALSPPRPPTLAAPGVGESPGGAPWPGGSGLAPRPPRSGRRTPRPSRE
ncbi:MAG: hypothetical protein ACLPKE_30370 [Streptosporangiaceae bacterium]